MRSFSSSLRCGGHASMSRTACASAAPVRAVAAVRSRHQLRAAVLASAVGGGGIRLRRQSSRTRPALCVASLAAPNASSDTSSPRSGDPPSVGIDLGTSHSAIAVAPGGKPQLIRLLPENAARPSVSGGGGATSASRAGVLLPSVVFYPGDEGGGGGGQAKPLVGTAALVAAAAAAAAAAAKAAAEGSGGSGGDASSNLVRSSKRLMGKKAEEEDSPSFLKIAVPSRPEPLLPQQVATEIISALLDAAQAHFDGQRPSRAVVSVPAYFSKEARAATEEAARAAGLRTVRLVREPVAAALGYGLRPGAPRDETVLVVDLGGGTFDVSLLEVGGGAVEVLSTGGDASLGGDDWDAALADLIGATFLSPAGVTDWKAPSSKSSSASAPLSPARASLLGAARAAKEALSAAPAVELTLSSGPSPIVARVTRAMLDEVGEPLFARAAAAIDEACFQSGVEIGESVARWRESVARAEAEASEGAKAKEGAGAGAAAASSSLSSFKLRPKRRPPVSRVLLVGGGTRMWGFDAFIENLTGLSPTKAKRVEKKEEKEEEEKEDKGNESDSSSSSALSLDVVDPDTSVAAGAALQAAMLDGDPALSGVVVLDVWQAGLARALAEARLAAEEKRAANGESGDDDDDDDGFFENGGDDDEGELLEDGNRLVFSPPPPQPSKTKLRKQRARAANRSKSAGGKEKEL